MADQSHQSGDHEDGRGSEHADVPEPGRPRGVSPDVTLGRIPRSGRKPAADSELPHRGVREVREAPRGDARRRRNGARSLDHPVWQQHGQQRRAQQRSAAAGADRPRRRPQRQPAPALQAGHAAREHPGDDARRRGDSEHRAREVRRYHRGVLGGMKTLVAVALALAIGAPAYAQVQPVRRSATREGGKKEDVNRRKADGSTPLQWAVYNGDVAEATRLVRAGADVSLANNYGATPMSLAAEVGNTDMLKLLLEAGANVDSPNPDGQTALLAVARTGNVAAAKLLLDHGATIDAKEKFGGQTALMWASARRHPEMMQLLISKGADVNAISTDRDYQRHVTAEGRPKSLDSGGFTPLLYAARENCGACVDVLLKNNADINLPDPDGVSPLLLAIMNAN